MSSNQVEVWADVVCPWCYIGKRRLELAASASKVQPEVLHRAFQLDPTATSDGRLTTDVLAEKYGVSTEQARAMMANVTDVARSVGLDYNLDRTVNGNTRDAHRLALWAQESGSAQPLLDTLYRAYFTDARPVFTMDELVEVAGEAGFASQEVRALLESNRFIDQVATDQREAADLGATGVPFFVIDRRVGVAGAQPQEVFEQAFAQVNAQG